MKANFRTFFLAIVVALMTTGVALPACASTGGSNPRPTSGATTSSEVLAAILTVLGY